MSRSSLLSHRLIISSLKLFLLGALGGSTVDALHTRMGISLYPGGAPGATPWWWVVPELGLGAVAYGLIRTRVWPGPGPSSWITHELAIFFTALMFGGWALCALGLPVLATCLGLLPCLVMGVLVLDRSLSGVLWALSSGLAGACVEIVLCRTGLYAYDPTANHMLCMGVPLWLPLVHSGLATCAGSLAMLWQRSRP